MESFSKSLMRGIDILDVFAREGGELNLSNIAALTGLHVTTVFRLVSTLAQRGYLKQNGDKGTYSLGLKMLDFTFAIRRDMKYLDMAYLSLSKLCKELNESVYMGVLDNNSLLVIEEIGVQDDMRINSPIGKRLPLYCTACGKVLLSALPDEERRAYFTDTSLHSYTKNTVTEISALENEMESIKSEGVGFQNEEYRMGIWSVAAPISNGSGKTISAVGLV
ncbi:MAG TPA: IclR family transcriptional regulator, partial [Dehalococcoidales bacterium]|nr:IclR family transcriptional regulator [Dehalococcoidales bacterium]